MNLLGWFGGRGKGRFEAFTFGDPTPVLDGGDLLSLFEVLQVGNVYETPIPWDGIAKSSRSAVHHASALQLKVNVLTSTFIPHRLLSKSVFHRFALDFMVFGNGYLERKDNRLGGALALEAPLGKYVRRGVDLSSYYYSVANGFGFMSRGYDDAHQFKAGSIFHLMEPDINQDIYGIPYYLAGLSSAWLNESATLFRRKYYKNGSHAGYILYITDPAQNDDDIEALRKAMKESKGPGNFRNLLYYAPNGKKDGIQLIPAAEVMARDEFLNIKTTTRDDLLAIHRTPPQVMGVVPANTGGFGDALTAAQVFSANEVEPLQERFREINDWIGEEVVRFRPYTLAVAQGGAQVVM
jgi:PBSX family phage portal protein